MNILITAAATAQAYQLERLVGGTEAVFFADSAELPQFMLKNRKFIKISEGNAPSFAHELLGICLDQQIERVFPLRKGEIKALSESRTLFMEYGIQVIVPPLPALEKMEMRNGPGRILIKTDLSDQAGLLPDADFGLFLINEEYPDSRVAIFTAD
ncbi:hypothetical protein BDE36_3834 [Arcticibacter tournemirensis]|uniref:Uncharacterized protein n=1 Tax=Arcticibacter tournemirensis TaxID=699437 RepID=A0A5M9HGV0_9SPHI|nr:hypothetical protein [Arcticibacter tournemirensis]KAA8486236.1 hypothetical protein F1649_01195 [Arcticibacter tournemirensis]TQM52037.1 hypothetical protein BDE36_3834 [Arcticibacter tournemirensis]